MGFVFISMLLVKRLVTIQMRRHPSRDAGIQCHVMVIFRHSDSRLPSMALDYGQSLPE